MTILATLFNSLENDGEIVKSASFTISLFPYLYLIEDSFNNASN